MEGPSTSFVPHSAQDDRRFESGAHTSASQLHVLVRSLAQLDAALAAGVATIYCDFEDPKGYREAVRRFRGFPMPGNLPNRSILVAPPRVFKTGEDWILKMVRSAEPDGYLVRNYDHLSFFAGEPVASGISRSTSPTRSRPNTSCNAAVWND